MADLDRGLRVLAKQENEVARRVALLLAAGRTPAEAGRELDLSRPELQEARRRLRWAAERARAE
jgi:DNA-binding CsgD family transcriptional regulator